MEEVEKIRRGRAEPFDLPIRKPVNRGQDTTLVRAAAALLQELPERDLVVTVLVDVRNAQFGFPEEGVVGAFEDLPLFGNRSDDGFKGGTFVDVPECRRLNLVDDQIQTAPDRPSVFYDPRALEMDGPAGVLHAKAVVIDDEAVFVTSANLTEAALDRNIEMGLLVRDAALAASVSSHFRVLIDRSVLRPLPIA